LRFSVSFFFFFFFFSSSSFQMLEYPDPGSLLQELISEPMKNLEKK